MEPDDFFSLDLGLLTRLSNDSGQELVREWEWAMNLKNAIALFSSEMTWGGHQGTFDPHIREMKLQAHRLEWRKEVEVHKPTRTWEISWSKLAGNTATGGITTKRTHDDALQPSTEYTTTQWDCAHATLLKQISTISRHEVVWKSFNESKHLRKIDQSISKKDEEENFQATIYCPAG